MHKGAEAILKSLVGDKGVQTLSKAIFRRTTESVADPMELYLPLMVVPRAILSWLVQNIHPLKVGEHKDFPLPGQPGVMFHVEKQASDVYRGEIVKEGRIIHSFDKQSLPSIGGHLMTVMEDYGHLKEGSTHDELVDKEIAKNPEAELPKQHDVSESSTNSAGIVRTIMHMNGVSMESSESGSLPAVMQFAAIRSLTESIGTLVDALVRRRSSEGMDKKEIKPDDGKVKESHMPEQQKSKDVIEAGKPLEQVRQESAAMDADKQAKIMSKDYDPKTVKAGEAAADAKPKKESIPHIKKDEIPAAKPKADYFRSRQQRIRKEMGDMGPMTGDNVMSGAGAGVGGMAKGAPQPNAIPVGAGGVKPGLKQPKGQMGIPVIKEELDKKMMGGAMKPGGAGMAIKPMSAQMPKPPVPAGNKPAAAQKQTQISAMGGTAKPAMGTMNKPIGNNPMQTNMKPKVTAMKAEVSGYSTSNPPGKEIPQILDRPASHPGHRSLRSLIHSDKQAQAMGKSEAFVSEDDLFRPCEHCGKAEFAKSEGKIRFSPCACFMALAKDDEGRDTKFVELSKTEAGYKLTFDPKADADSVKTFCLVMKSKILLRKRFGV